MNSRRFCVERMPLVSEGDDSHSFALARDLTSRFEWTGGLLLDAAWEAKPHWLVSRSAFERWFDIIEEELQTTLGRRLAHAAADSEEARSESYIRPRRFFGRFQATMDYLNADWALRGLGRLESPAKPAKDPELDLEVEGRLLSCLSAGMANAAWEWMVRRRYRFRWEDRGADRAMVHLDLMPDEVAPPESTATAWPIPSEKVAEGTAIHPLVSPSQLGNGCWEVDQERHVLLSLDLIVRFERMTSIYSDATPLHTSLFDWGEFELGPSSAKVWSAMARSMYRIFVESDELFLIAEPEQWLGATREPLSEHGLGFITSALAIDQHGGVELGFHSIFHPALVTGVLMGCWSRAHGRAPSGRWARSDDGGLRLALTAKDEIAPS